MMQRDFMRSAGSTRSVNNTIGYSIDTHFSSKQYDFNLDYYKISDDPYMFCAKHFQVLSTYKFSTFVSIGTCAILIWFTFFHFQAQCKKWWEKLTPEQRREKRKQYNLKWRQNQKKNLLGDASDSSDSKEGDWQQQQQLPASSSSSYGRANEQLLKIPTAPGALLASSASSSAEYYGKGGNNGNGVPTGPVFNVVSGSVVYPFSYFPFRCQVQQSGTARGNSA